MLAASFVVVAALAAPLSAVAATGTSAASAEVPESTETLARKFSAAMSLGIAPRSMCLTVLLDDDAIFEAQSDSALVPASLMKIVTAAAALDVLVGPLSGLLINDGFASYTWKTGSEDRRDYLRTSDPARHAASVFNNLLEGRGIVITRRPQDGVAPEPPDLTSLASIDSRRSLSP